MNRRHLRAAALGAAAVVSAAAGQPAGVQMDGPGPAVPVTDGVACPPRVVTSAISSSTAARIVRNSVASDCGLIKAFPGSVAGNFRYRTFTYENVEPAAECVTITLASNCEGLMVSAYLNSFNPANPAQNYLGDAGNSITEGSFNQRTFRVSVPFGQTLVVVVQETEENQTCVGFRLGVQGFACQKVQNPLTIGGRFGLFVNSESNWIGGFGETSNVRLTRSGEQSQCGVPKPCPGPEGGPVSRRFRLYPIVNTEPMARCVTVQFNNPTCGSQTQIIARNSLPDPANPCAGYLADTGYSTGGGQTSFSLVMQPDQLVWLQVIEIEENSPCSEHTIRVMGLSDFEAFQYPNCDGSTSIPQLNALDFSCFLQRFQAGLESGN